jgi:hypothetical protein
MGHHGEVFVGLDAAKLRIAVAESGRNGEVQFLGEIDKPEVLENSPSKAPRIALPPNIRELAPPPEAARHRADPRNVVLRPARVRASG